MKEQKQSISKVFIQDCFTTIFPCVGLQGLMETLERGDLLTARSVFHDIVESLKPEFEEIIDDGERIIYNAKVQKYLNVNKLYDQLFEMLIEKDLVMEPKKEISE